MHFTCRSFLGSHDSLNWSQYWENEPDDYPLVSQRGHLFGLICLSLGSPLEDLSHLGRRLIEEISQQYYSLPGDNIDQILKNLIRKISDSELFDTIKYQVIIAVVHQHSLHCICLYGGHVTLLRQGKISKILSSPSDTFSQISGPIQPEDRILLSSNNFLTFIGWDQVKSNLAGEKVQTVEENFLSSIYSLKSQDGVAAALVQIDSDEFEPNPVEVEPPFGSPEQTAKEAPVSSKPSFLKSIFRPKSVYVTPLQGKEVSKRHRLNIIISVVLLLGLFFSAYLGKTRSDSSRRETQYQQLKDEIQQKINNAAVVKNLNIESAYDMAKQAKDLSTKLQSLHLHSVEADILNKQVDVLLTQTGSSDVFSPAMFYDTSLIHNSPNYQYLSISGNSLYLLDPDQGRIDSVSATDKSTKNISTNTALKSALGLAEVDNNVYVYNDQNILLATKNSVDAKASFTDIGKQITPLSLASWNGSLYLLDSQTPTIYKFTPNNVGFGKAENWIKPGQTFPTGTSSLTINGKVWVISQSGQITPFIRGVKDNYKSPSTSIKFAKLLSTSASGEILAFVDTDSLIYVYGKNGDISAKYNLGSKKILGLVMDPQSTNLFALCTDQKIYKISL